LQDSGVKKREGAAGVVGIMPAPVSVVKRGKTLKPKPSVLISVLCGHERGDWINPGLVNRLFEAISESATERPLTCGLTCGVKPVDKARNQIVQQFLKTDAGWLVMVDSDVYPPAHFMRVITAAEEHGKRVVGLPCPMIGNSGVALNVGYKTESRELAALYTNNLPSGWTSVDYVGTGLIAIHRCVLETIKAPWFEFTPQIGEDFNFCRKAQATGIEVWTHGSFICDHLHTYSLLDMLRARRMPA
jgi:hypothetical protein